MSSIRPVTYKFKQGDTDSNGRTVQRLNTIHRAVLMGMTRPKSPAATSHFSNPAGVATYYGFGADGQYYEAGVQGRTWRNREALDDFTDKLTDTVRWVGIGTDLSEGGIDLVNDAPFGKRLFAQYANSGGVEVFDRKGLMVFSHPASGTRPALSSRVYTPGEGNPIGVNLETCALLAIQQSASDVDYVFVGYANTNTHPFSVVMGDVVAGVATVRAVQALPTGTTSIDIAVDLDFTGSQYRGWYSLSLKGEDAFGVPWIPVSGYVATPAGWPSDAVPRFHVSMGAATPNDQIMKFADVRVEEGGTWAGEQQASWFLEPLDGTNPTEMYGTRQVCPGEVLVSWERGQSGQCHLTLLDMDDVSDVQVWRRWENMGVWEDWNRDDWPWWSPGWMDADEGHIVLSRHTKAHLAGSADPLAGRGEIWIFSLRWDRVLVLNTHGLGCVLAHESAAGEMMREIGSWGSRRWMSGSTYQTLDNYDHTNRPDAGTPWVGVLAKLGSEDARPGLTYGVHIRRCDNDLVHIGYGIQEIPDVYPGGGQTFAGLIQLEEGPTPHFKRWLMRKNDSSFSIWDHTDESWVQSFVMNNRGVWWTQAKEDGAFDELEGVLCRVDTTAHLEDNVMTAPIHEDSSWIATDLLGPAGLHLWVEDNVTGGFGEVVVAVGGWLGGSWVTVLWYNNVTPSQSEIRTYGVLVDSEKISDIFDRRHPRKEYPRWFSMRQDRELAGAVFPSSDVDLKECRMDLGAYTGDEAFTPVSTSSQSILNPGSTIPSSILFSGVMQRLQWKGVQAKLYRHRVLKPVAIEKGDFVLEWVGKVVPPWSGGQGFQVLDQMSAEQQGLFRLGVLGSKRLNAFLELRWEGNQSGTGGLIASASLSYQNSSGQQGNAAGYIVPALGRKNGAGVRVRLIRKNKVWNFEVWDESTQTFVVVLSQSGLNVPVLPYMETQVQDAEGQAASAAMVWSAMTLGPAGNQVGSRHVRMVQYPVLRGVLGSVAFGSSQPEYPLLKTSGALVVGHAFATPMLMPR